MIVIGERISRPGDPVSEGATSEETLQRLRKIMVS